MKNCSGGTKNWLYNEWSDILSSLLSHVGLFKCPHCMHLDVLVVIKHCSGKMMFYDLRLFEIKKKSTQLGHTHFET